MDLPAPLAACTLQRRRFASALGLLPCPTLWSPFGARAQPAAVPALDLSALRAAMQAWLEQAGVSPELELRALRWGAQDRDMDARWLMLELDFRRPEGTATGHAEAARALFGRFRERTGTPLADALLFRLVHASGLPRQQTRVTLMLGGEKYAVQRDAAGNWHFAPVATRQERVSAALPAGDVAALRVAVPSGAALAQRVQQYLVETFQRHNAAAGRPPPRLALKPLEPDYAALDVAGVRRLVIRDRDLWERLQVSVELRSDAQGLRAVCYLDGAYASGLGQRPPADADYTDMERAYRAELQGFGHTLLRGLQEHLAPGPARR